MICWLRPDWPRETSGAFSCAGEYNQGMEPNPYQSPQGEPAPKPRVGVLSVLEILLLIVFLGTVPLLAILPWFLRLFGLPSS